LRKNGKKLSERKLTGGFWSLVVASLQKQSYGNARTDIEELEKIFSRLSSLDVSDELLHVRTLVTSARTFHMLDDFKAAIQG
jgi:hypothetical protein